MLPFHHISLRHDDDDDGDDDDGGSDDDDWTAKSKHSLVEVAQSRIDWNSFHQLWTSTSTWNSPQQFEYHNQRQKKQIVHVYWSDMVIDDDHDDTYV